jgi:hypothetical protein
MSDNYYWVSKEIVYKLWSDVDLTDSQVQELIENGAGTIKQVNWDVERD